MASYSNNDNKVVYRSGFSIGWIIAAVLSYSMFKSVGWAIVAAIFGWLYVIYYLIVYGFTIGPNLPL